MRRRQRLAFLIRAAAFGLLAGGLAGASGALAQWWLLGAASVWQASAATGAGLLVGVAVGLLWRWPWHAAAAAVDAHYRLKDRSTTALEFLTRPDAGDLHHLQIADALDHLGRVEPAAVVPLRAPRALPYAAAALIAAGVLPFVYPARRR